MLLLAGAAIVLLLGWTLSSGHWVDVLRREPPQGAAAEDKHYAVKQLLRRLDVPVHQADGLQQLPPPGATLVLTSEHWDFLPQGEQALRRWVEQGGHLVLPVYRSVGKSMKWVPIGPAPDRKDAAERAKEELADRQREVAARQRPQIGPPYPPPRGCDPHVESGEAVTIAPGGPRSLRLCELKAALRSTGGTPVLWQLGQPERAAMLRVPVGRGRVSAVNAVFDWDTSLNNRSLFNGQHAEAAIALIDARPGQPVWFVADERRPSLAAWLWHWAAAAIVLGSLAAAFALWRSAVRFGPLLPGSSLARRSLTEQIRGTAAFVMRGGGGALAAASRRALEQAAARRLPGYRALDDTERAAAVAAAVSLPVPALTRALNPAHLPRGRALVETLALIETARRRLSRREPHDA